MVEPGDWTGPGGAQQILARRDIDVAVLETARGGIVLRGVGYESNDASVLTNVSSDHLDLQGIHTLPELAEVKSTDLPDHEARRLGRAQRRRPARRRGRRAGPGQRRAVHARTGDALGRSSGATGDARRPGLPRSRRRRIVEADGAAETRDRRGRATCRSRSAAWPATTSPTPSPRPAAARGLGRDDRPGRATGCADFRPVARTLRPGRLNLFRLGPTDRDRRLRPQRGRGRGRPRRRRGDRRRRGRPGGADHRDHRHRRRPARRHAPRASAGSPPSGPSGSRSRRRSSTCAAGPRSRSSASCWPASMAGGAIAVRRADLRDRDRGAPGRAERRGTARSRPADARGSSC